MSDLILKRVFYKEPWVGDLQSNIQRLFDKLVGPTIRGKRIIGVPLTAGVTNYIEHGLGGRDIVGWHTSRVRADCRIWDEQDSELNRKAFLRLRTSADVVVDLVVF